MKNTITISTNDNKLHFYLNSGKNTYYLFTQKFSKGVYDYFCRGRLEDELKSFRKWDRNPRLDKTIEKIPMYTKYVMKEIA